MNRTLVNYGLTQWAPHVEALVPFFSTDDLRKPQPQQAFTDALLTSVDPTYAAVLELMMPLVITYAEEYRRFIYC